jgi:hypothetical protein
MITEMDHNLRSKASESLTIYDTLWLLLVIFLDVLDIIEFINIFVIILVVM